MENNISTTERNAQNFDNGNINSTNQDVTAGGNGMSAQTGQMSAEEVITTTSKNAASELTELAGLIDKAIKDCSFLESTEIWDGAKKNKRLETYLELKEQSKLLIEKLPNVGKVVEKITTELLTANQKTNDGKFVVSNSAVSKALSDVRLTFFGGVFDSPFATKGALVLASDYGYRILRDRSDKHFGIDLRPVEYEYGKNYELASISDGEVVDVGYNGGRGYYIDILATDPTTGKPVKILYSHLKYKPEVKKEDSIEVGDVIGVMGTTGDSTGDHLDLKIMVDTNDDGSPDKYTDPLPYITSTTRPDGTYMTNPVSGAVNFIEMKKTYTREKGYFEERCISTDGTVTDLEY